MHHLSASGKRTAFQLSCAMLAQQSFTAALSCNFDGPSVRKDTLTADHQYDPCIPCLFGTPCWAVTTTMMVKAHCHGPSMGSSLHADAQQTVSGASVASTTVRMGAAMVSFVKIVEA